MSQVYSVSPDGKRYPLPKEEDYGKEFERLKAIAEEQRSLGKEIVVVMGLGFVGAVMAAVVADSTDRKTGEAKKFVIGMQRPSPRSFWKIPMFNTGVSPVKAEDPEVDILIRRCVMERKNSHCNIHLRCLEPCRCGRCRCAVRLPQAGPRELHDRPGGDRSPGRVHEGYRGEDRAPLPCPDRNDRAARNHRIYCIPDVEKGLRFAQHQQRAAPCPQLRTGHAREGVC